MANEPKDRKATNSRFAKGTSGNPAGRPPGSRNRATLLMEALFEGEAEQLTRKAIELAMAGDINAMRLCLDRLLPARKDRPIHLSLPPVSDLVQVSSTMSIVVEAIGSGSITPSEGETLANVLAIQKDVLTSGSLEIRVALLEQRVSALKNEEVAQGGGGVNQPSPREQFPPEGGS
jgi:hypothetical protein